MHLLSVDVFIVLWDIIDVLEVPHLAQELVSAERTPTLSIALPAYEKICSTWEYLKEQKLFLVPYITTGIDKITEYVFKSRSNPAYGIAMSMTQYLRIHSSFTVGFRTRQYCKW
jgi:hypothetical protein